MSNDWVPLLRSVSFFSELDDATLREAATTAYPRQFRAGSRIVSELEFGSDVYIMVQGHAEVSVEAGSGKRRLIDVIGPAATFGEMASLTGELRSATVTAQSDVEVLVLTDAKFSLLTQRRPEIAVALVRTLAQRLRDAERTIDGLLTASTASEPIETASHSRSHRSLQALWDELVVNHQKDLAFLTLAAFVVTLAAVRVAVFISFAYELAPRDVLRAAYIGGFGLLVLSACSALLTFRPVWRRAVAVAYGIGSALIINELGVTLAFDIFYKDTHTPDPALPFDIEQLYRRTEPLRAIVIGLVVLVQAVYLRGFCARAWFLLDARLRRLLHKANGHEVR